MLSRLSRQPCRSVSMSAKSLGIEAMLAKQTIECLPIEIGNLRSSGDVARVAVELASQVRCFEQTDILNLCRAEAKFARPDTGGGLRKHVR